MDAFKGTWDYVDGDNQEEYLRELGVGFMIRKIARGLKPRVVIDETAGKWSIRTETSFKTTTVEFIPGVEFTDLTSDGRELKGTIQFQDDKWIQKMRNNQDGKQSTTTRWIDENDQMKSISTCGKATVHKLYKRVHS